MSDLKIAVVGGGGVGKSALTVQFVHSKFLADYEPTIEDSFRRQVKIDEKVWMLHILDTAGQEEFSIVNDTHLRKGDGFLLIYSIIDFASFSEIPKIRSKILMIKEETSNVPIVIVGNKSDLEKQRKVHLSEAQDLAKSFQTPFFETSAKTRYNVDEIFFSIARMIRNQKFPEFSDSKNIKKKKKKRCLIL
ncbi:ras-like protein [Anaeramoeba ignava]|uniref:small monomeric GTPase n=1 Tax=Anaeramoeba ignava TaxID=1746090 RepID=A0A9Q0L8Y0_ANAIG|nr:ras-like protein [Anaeramoeba ignava]